MAFKWKLKAYIRPPPDERPSILSNHSIFWLIRLHVRSIPDPPSTGISGVFQSAPDGEGPSSGTLHIDETGVGRVLVRYTSNDGLVDYQHYGPDFYQDNDTTTESSSLTTPEEFLSNWDVPKTYGTLLRAQFSSFMAGGFSLVPWAAKAANEFWDGINTLEFADFPKRVVKRHFDNLKAGLLSWDATFCKYQRVIPKRGPKIVEECDSDCQEECQKRKAEQKAAKVPAMSADREMYEAEQKVPGHGEWGNKIPAFIDHSKYVKAMERADRLLKGLQVKYDSEIDGLFEKLTEPDLAIWNSIHKDCEAYSDLINKTIADVTEAVLVIKDWYEAYEKALEKKSGSFIFTLGGREIEWKVTLQSKIERPYPYKLPHTI